MFGLSGARAVVLGISLLTMVAAYMMIGPSAPPEPVRVVQEAPRARTVDVLIAAADLPLGNTLTPNDVRWVAWPEDHVPQGAIRRDQAPQGDTQAVGALVRSAFVAAEPIRAEKLIRPDGSGFLSAVLPAGKRAVAIAIDRAGNSTAGGFVLPNDRVDLIRIGRQEGQQGGDGFVSETILTNIKVLAIGQQVQERNGERVVVGETATLELDPRQVEVVTLAQRSGTLSMALRSLADAGQIIPPEANERQGLTLVRFGVTTQSARQ
jgi:pilus assembly protein CpaB